MDTAQTASALSAHLVPRCLGLPGQSVSSVQSSWLVSLARGFLKSAAPRLLTPIPFPLRLLLFVLLVVNLVCRGSHIHCDRPVRYQLISLASDTRGSNSTPALRILRRRIISRFVPTLDTHDARRSYLSHTLPLPRAPTRTLPLQYIPCFRGPTYPNPLLSRLVFLSAQIQ